MEKFKREEVLKGNAALANTLPSPKSVNTKHHHGDFASATIGTVIIISALLIKEIYIKLKNSVCGYRVCECVLCIRGLNRAYFKCFPKCINL